MTDITVLMAVFNGAAFLDLAVQSVLDQTHYDFEFLIVDDGSTDCTANTIQKYAGRDNRIRIVKNLVNMGLTRSLNLGLRKAEGKYIVRMDADDLALPERLQVQYDFLQAHPEVGLVSSCFDIIDQQGVRIKTECYGFTPEDLFYRMHFSNPIAHSSVMFRRDLVVEMGGYDEACQVAQDYELWSRLIKKTQFFLIPRVLTCWRRSQGSITDTMAKEQRAVVERGFFSRLRELTGKTPEPFVAKALILPGRCDFGYTQFLDICQWLETIHKQMMTKNRSLVEQTGLKKKRLRKIMTHRFDEYLFSYFRYESENRWHDFFHLKVKWQKRFLQVCLQHGTAKFFRLLGTIFAR